jgi:hypothetical protein
LVGSGQGESSCGLQVLSCSNMWKRCERRRDCTMHDEWYSEYEASAMVLSVVSQLYSSSGGENLLQARARARPEGYSVLASTYIMYNTSSTLSLSTKVPTGGSSLEFAQTTDFVFPGMAPALSDRTSPTLRIPVLPVPVQACLTTRR